MIARYAPRWSGEPPATIATQAAYSSRCARSTSGGAPRPNQVSDAIQVAPVESAPTSISQRHRARSRPTSELRPKVTMTTASKASAASVAAHHRPRPTADTWPAYSQVTATAAIANAVTVRPEPRIRLAT